MLKCDRESKRKRGSLESNRILTPIIHKGNETPIINNALIDKNINTLMREVNAKYHEKRAMKNIFPETWRWIDREARDCFGGGVGNGTLKCVYGYNHHGVRNAKINKELTNEECPRCGKREDWTHVILCEGINEIKYEYLNDVKSNIEKLNLNDEEKQNAEMIIDDIENYILVENKEFITTQHLIGMKMLYRGWVVKNWMNIEERNTTTKMKKMNKVLVKQSVIFYSKAWAHRNKILHDQETYRKYMIDWYQNIKIMIEISDKPDMRRYLRTYAINVDMCSTRYIKRWNIKALEMFKKNKERKYE